MKYLDYRQTLGIGFNDKEKMNLFKIQILNKFDSYNEEYYDQIDYREFCNYIAIRFFEDCVSNTFDDVLSDLSELNDIEFLYGTVVFFNTLAEDNNLKNSIYEDIVDSLNKCNMNYELINDGDGIFIFPKGAKEFDDALVSEQLEWLKKYPKAYATYNRALKQYANGEHVRDVADNFRKALEEFFQEFLGNTKNLANNKTEICKFLVEHSAEPEISSMMQALLNSYDKLNNGAAKHHDKLDAKYLEFLMYQTGLFIRMIITVGKES